MRKKIVCAALAAALSMTLLAGCGSSSENTTAATETTEAPTTASTAAATETTEAATEPVTEEVTEAYKPEEPDEYQEYPNSAEYHLVWEENFDYKEKKKWHNMY